MGFLLTLEYCERAGRGQASLSLSLNSPTPLFILCTSVWVVGVFPACAAGGRPQQPETPPRGGEAGREPARSQAGPLWGGEGDRTGSELPRSCRPPVRAQKAGSSAQPAPQLRAAGGALLPRRARWRGPSAARSSPAVPGLRGGASPMAEGRRREDEEEELRERRELGGPRRARSRALPGHSAADRNERHKPEHRSSSQGPLSSIRAVIKRSSRTCIQSELHRDRRRPEITIVAAEPLRPASWFPGAPPPGLGFPSTPGAGPWRPNDLVPAELPPSYEQVIKEINQVQVNATNNNNAAATPRSTITSATQTDFPEDIDSDPPPTLQAPLKPLQPSPAASAGNLPPGVAPLIVFDICEEQTCPENPSATRCPVPRPRSKSNLRPVARDANSKEKNSQKSPVTPREDWPPHCLLDSTCNLDSQAMMNIMNTEQSQNTIVSRIKAFEGQTNTEIPGLPKKPEIIPRTIPPKPAVSSGKPLVAPKPAANRVSGEWDTWAENRLKVTSREGLTPYSSTQEAGITPVTKPELPKKPTPGLTRSVNHETSGGRPMAESPDTGKKIPTPAPRPLLPKKSASTDAPPYPSIPPKLVSVPPRLSVASQAKAFRSLGEGLPSNPPVPAPQSKALGDIDLISFDDDVLPTSGSPAEEPTGSETVLDPFQLPTKTEATKERAVQPAPTRKPTVIRIPAKPGKCLHEEPQSPPPLPAEKPVGNTHSAVSGRLSHSDRTRNPELEQASESGALVQGPPRLPPRPVHGKVIPVWRPPPKGAPERPPPPKLPASKSSNKNLPFNRSSSDMDLQKKQSHFVSGLSKAKSQIFKNQDPVLPPRPKPGHPLYRKYMLSVPHGIASEDIVSRNPTELSCKRGDVLVILKQAENNYLECQRGEGTGRVHPSQMKIVTPLDERPRGRPNDSGHSQKPVDSGAPHAVALHDFPAEQADDLSLTSGEIVYLLEKIDAEWYRGKCRNQTGVFPANYVKVIVDIPEGRSGKRESFSSHCANENCSSPKGCSKSQDCAFSGLTGPDRAAKPMDEGPRCVARFEYIGDQKDELSFSEGEVIILTEYVNEEWGRGEIRDRSGIFPLNFVELVGDHPTSGANILSTKVPPKTKNEDPGSNSQDSSPPGEWCKALHSFTAETSEDLPFKRGDRILILERLDSDWYRGRLHDREGIFPAVFVQPCPAEAKGVASAIPKGRKVKALYDFLGENEDELSFKAGDVITELEPIDDGWMRGELMGRAGMFPKNYVQFLQVS